jgi:hypothetical protein
VLGQKRLQSMKGLLRLVESRRLGLKLKSQRVRPLHEHRASYIITFGI